MPRPRDDEGTVAPQVATGGGPVPPPPVSGPYLPTPVLPPGSGLRGRARLDAEIASSLFANNPWSHDFNQWVLSLKEDPSDPEYSAALQWAKANAQRHEQGLASAITGPHSIGISASGVDPLKPGPSSQSASGGYPQASPAGQSGVDPLKPGPTSTSASGLGVKPARESGRPDPRTIKNQEGTDREQLRQAKFIFETQPAFKGRPVGTDELYQPKGPADPYLDGFLSENGINLSGNDRNKAVRSGKYVLMGYEVSPEHGGKKPIYMYVDDAAAAGQRVESAVLAKYQEELELPVTGRMEGWLKQVWDKAVAQAQDSAITGLNITVREWFDLMVQSAIVQKKAKDAKGRGGGGGGGGARMEEFDYYRAMMQILGDISGVEG